MNPKHTALGDRSFTGMIEHLSMYSHCSSLSQQGTLSLGQKVEDDDDEEEDEDEDEEG